MYIFVGIYEFTIKYKHLKNMKKLQKTYITSYRSKHNTILKKNIILCIKYRLKDLLKIESRTSFVREDLT